MGVVLKESLLNEGFKHHKDVIKTYLILCVEYDSGASYYINVVQARKNSNNQSTTLTKKIRDVNEANKIFEDFDRALALEGFGLSRTRGQNSSEKKDINGQNPGLTPEELEKQKKEEMVRDLVNEIDDSLE